MKNKNPLKNTEPIKKKKLNLRVLNKMLKEKNKEITRYKGKYYILHITKTGVPVPLYHSTDLKDIKREISVREY